METLSVKTKDFVQNYIILNITIHAKVRSLPKETSRNA